MTKDSDLDTELRGVVKSQSPLNCARQTKILEHNMLITNKIQKRMGARLNAIAGHLRPSAVTADVGCDHGYLSLFVLTSNIANKVVCIDISPKCLQKTKDLLTRTNKVDGAEFLVSDGLKDVTQHVDQVIIAGMGGRNICDILENAPKHLLSAYFVLQPMNNITYVRRTLNQLGMCITHDEIVFDKNKYYHIICAQRGKQVLTLNQIRCGAVVEDYRSADYQRWLQLKIAKVSNILEHINSDSLRYIEMTEYLQSLKKCIF